MSEDSASPRQKYAAFIGIAYLAITFALFFYGYWSPLGIDFISYFHLSEFLHVAVFFDLPILFFLFFGSVVPALCVVTIKDKEARYSVPIYVGYCAVVIPLLVFAYCGFTQKAIVAICFVLVASLAVFLYLKNRVAELERNLRLMAVLLIPGAIGLPPLGFAYASHKADLIMTMSLEDALRDAISPQPIPFLSPSSIAKGNWKIVSLEYKPFVPVVDIDTDEQSVKDQLFLGRIGEHYFCLDPVSKHRSVFRIEAVTRMVIKNLPTHPPTHGGPKDSR